MNRGTPVLTLLNRLGRGVLARFPVLMPLLGLGLITAGAWVFHVAAGLIVAGLSVLVLELRGGGE